MVIGTFNMQNKYSVSWQDIEVVNNEQGRPGINIKNINLKNIESIDISLSHCKNYAVANVTVLVK